MKDPNDRIMMSSFSSSISPLSSWPSFDLDPFANMSQQQPAAPPSGILKTIVSVELYTNLLILWPILWLIILPLGLASNYLNIRTFLRMGLDDTVTISFFALALSDVFHLLLPLINVGPAIMLFFEAKFSTFFVIQPIALYAYLINLAALFNTLTCLITAYIALQRCLCIVMPFRFKSVFTNTRTWVMMGLLTFISVAYGVAYTSGYTIRPMNVGMNRTQYVLLILPSFVYIQLYVDTFLFMVINGACQIISGGSLIVMTYALAASVRFRKETSSSSSISTTVGASKSGKGGGNAESGDVMNGERAKQLEAEQKQNSKERTAIVQVALLSAIYLATHIPKLAVAIGAVVVDEFKLGRMYTNFFFVAIAVRVTSDYLNSSVNIFIYYKYNSKFRKLIFGKGKKRV